MKFSFICSIFVLLITIACTRSTPSGQQIDPVLPSSKTEATTNNSFGTPIFKGSGNEPFWSLQIDEGHTLILKSIDDHQFKINMPIAEITRVNDANALKLTATAPDKTITIMLMENSCQDNMSGKKSSHGLQVVIKDDSTEKPVFYKGCGEFLNEYLVNNNWELESMNGTNVAALPIEKKPTLNINLLENKVNGFAGCNSFFGMVAIEKERLKFDNLGLTKKLCKDNTTEAVIMKLLNDNTQKHVITPDGNLLIKNAEYTLIFKTMK